jgi:hypothetical protein
MTYYFYSHLTTKRNNNPEKQKSHLHKIFYTLASIGWKYYSAESCAGNLN